MACENTPGASTQAMNWRLHTVMSERGIRTATELHRRLQHYEVDITIHQLTRIVAALPARLNTQVLAALMTELQCDASELLRLEGDRAGVRTRRARKGPPASGALSPAKVATDPAPEVPVPAPPKALAQPSRTPQSVLGPEVLALARIRPPEASQ
jgi:hypothetical protein